MEAAQFFKQSLPQEVWATTYKWETDVTVLDTFQREAGAFAANQDDPSLWSPKYFDVLSNLRYVPGGRIISNAGTGLTGTSWINCFVSGFKGKDRDSIQGIYAELTRQARILKSEGGYGICINTIRPYGAYIKGIGSESPGTVAMLDLWDTSSSVITSGTSAKKNKGKGKNKIRKGAMMVTQSVWHPDIEDYIVSKQRPGKLSKFNMSVLIHDNFMEAVKNHQPWHLEFPETDHPQYADEWHGNLYTWKAKGYPTKIYKTYEDANELWEIITKSTYNRNEPGIIFIDRVNHLNNLYYCEEINATNPCGEQPLPPDASCNLGAINLTQYVLPDGSGFDFEKLDKDIPVIMRMQDSVNDLTYFPLEEQKEQAHLKRRVGIGYMGYGSALYMLKLSYGSQKALEVTEELCSFVTNKLYQASAMLAKEKGAFPAFDKEKFLQSNFVKQALTPETIALISQYGLRNSHITTVAPTGNTGIFANLVSGGLEPVISHFYTRTLIVPEQPEGLVLPININWDLAVCENQDDWSWVKEGDESLLRKEFNGTVYKIDRGRGLTKEEDVYDYAVLEMGEDFEKDKAEALAEGKDFYGKTIFDLKVEDHLSTMAVFAKYIDSAISKTINVPEDYSYEDFKSVYMQAYETGTIKGVTTYRWGTMTSVVSTKDSKKETAEGDRPTTVVINHAPKRPEVLPCDIHTTQIKGQKYYVLVGTLEGYPFEIFSGEATFKLPEKGIIRKAGSKKYLLECEGLEKPIDILETFGEHGSYGYSKMLQHGVPLWSIIDMCDKMLENVLGFNKAMGRIIKKYIKNDDIKFMKCGECGSTEMIFQEGCILCRSCGHSKCS